MELYLTKKEDSHHIMEKNRTIYTITSDMEDKLLSIHMKNVYDDEVISVYQIKRWFNVLLQDKMEDFTIYNVDEKLGELHKIKNGLELYYEGVYYRFYGGYHKQIRTIICFDRERQVGEFTLSDNPSVKFRNTSSNALFGILLYMFTSVIKEEYFSNEEYLRHYTGVYQDIVTA